MSSTNFTFDDVIQAVRQRLQDDAGRRIDDSDILNRYLPGEYQQLWNDRRDLFFGLYGANINFKPSQQDPLPFDDAGFTALVEAVIAAINESEEEAVSSGVAGMADTKSQRARKA